MLNNVLTTPPYKNPAYRPVVCPGMPDLSVEPCLVAVWSLCNMLGHTNTSLYEIKHVMLGKEKQRILQFKEAFHMMLSEGKSLMNKDQGTYIDGCSGSLLEVNSVWVDFPHWEMWANPLLGFMCMSKLPLLVMFVHTQANPFQGCMHAAKPSPSSDYWTL